MEPGALKEYLEYAHTLQSVQLEGGHDPYTYSVLGLRSRVHSRTNGDVHATWRLGPSCGIIVQGLI
jgi:hypothetical protein